MSNRRLKNNSSIENKMDLQRIHENLKHLKGTDLKPCPDQMLMQEIISATKRVRENLPHYVVPKNFHGINPVSSEKEHWAVIHAMAGIGIMGIVDRLQLHPTDLVIIYEPDPGLAFIFLSQVDLKAFFNDCKIFIYTSLNNFKTALNGIYEWWKEVHAWKSPFTSKQYPERVEEFHQQIIQHVMMGKVNLNTLNKLYFEWVKNETINLHQLKQKRCATCCGQHMENVPAILVGAGPSLRHGLLALKEIYKKQNALIIAASTTLRLLIPEGIIPHFVIIIEGEKQAHFDHIPHLDQLNLLAHLQTHPDHTRHLFKDIFWFNQETSPLSPFVQSILTKNRPLNFSGNVLSAAFLLTAQWGCNPIAFIGMDLAYPSGSKYMSGLEKSGEEDLKRNFYDVPGQNNEMLKAPPEFVSYARNLETAIELNQKAAPQLKVINASIGGRRISGTVEMPLEGFMTQITKKDPSLQPLLETFIDSCSPLPAAETARFLNHQKQTYRNLENILEKESSEPLGTDQWIQIRDLMNRLPEFTTGVSRLIQWIRNIRSGKDISTRNLDSLKVVIKDMLQCLQ